MFGFLKLGAPKGKSIQGLFAALDVGSSTVSCLLCYANGKDDVQVLGMGTRRADGMSGGNVINAQAAQQCILNALNQAEEVAGETVERVVLASNAGRPHSRLIELEMDTDGGIVNQGHLDSLAHHAKQPLDIEHAAQSTSSVRLHTTVIGYSLDGREGILNPIGMSARNLKAKYIAVTAQKSALQTLIDCIERCHLQVTDVVAGPLASAYGALNEEERQTGTTVIDFGADCTSIAAFHAGNPVHLEVLPTGSDMLTSDLAAALSCGIADAERIKCLHGAAFLRPTDGSVDVTAPSIDPYEAPTRVSRAYLVDVLQARLDELFDRISKRLDHPKLLPYSSKRIVLTGGGSGLVGIKDYVALRLGRATRLGRPMSLDGISHMRLSPSQTSAVGVTSFISKNRSISPVLARAHKDTQKRSFWNKGLTQTLVRPDNLRPAE